MAVPLIPNSQYLIQPDPPEADPLCIVAGADPPISLAEPVLSARMAELVDAQV